MWPKEHGAYGQVSFPLITAFAAAGVSTAGLLLAVVVVAAFLGHEPAAVLLGLRGPRAQRELRRRALRWLGAWTAIGAAASAGALTAIDPEVRWSMGVPLVPALLLAAATLAGREKSWQGETAAAVAFSGAAVPVAMASSATVGEALTVAIPFALFYVASTLAVRVVILRSRGGGDPQAASATRRAALLLATGGAAGLAAGAAIGLLPVSVSVAAAPGLLTAAALALRPPTPTRLRTVGWTLMAVSALTAALVIATTS